jgi:hypothetical protein
MAKELFRRPKRTLQAQVERYRAKYGDEFIQDVLKLAQEPFPSLRSVANKYGITRQAVHLLFPRITGLSYTSSIAARKTMWQEGRMKEVENHPLQKLAWGEICGRSPHSPPYKAWTAQLQLERVCKARGWEFAHESNHRVVINGKRALVRMSVSKSKTSPTNVVEYYRCDVPADLRDFLICRVEPRNEWWIFPPQDLKGRSSLYIPDQPKYVRSSYLNKIRKYLEAWQHFDRKDR